MKAVNVRLLKLSKCQKRQEASQSSYQRRMDHSSQVRWLIPLSVSSTKHGAYFIR